ncbi:uncharacterized protein N7484_004513 [Penicillium longicatenatum]|uniref:uncharacterized protein n=1 Tax=Penicillium longicatenatum TaxID=1561947 RepID=UPI0025466403|nr:uncharacterized protein N7484_004513 [Penicillium longicatenatum]KAJ5650790.1 hypothetical protein N7484_004513 [Penicillium longicatenatum]
MPKKHRTSLYTKPTNTPHHTLASSRANDNGRFQVVSPTRAQASTDDSSVNGLIDHLRRTQGNISGNSSSGSLRSFTSQRSVPPALRNILELPEPSQPRPRPNAGTLIGARPPRRVPGPPPPTSWLTGDTDGAQDSSTNAEADNMNNLEQIHRLQRLPGAAFPRQDSLQHAVLASMAQNWAWHVEYDGPYLSQLPRHIKVAILSYVAQFSQEEPLAHYMNGLTALFPTRAELEGSVVHTPNTDLMPERLDLSNALGRWLSFKKLDKTLRVTHPADLASKNATEENVPDSWDGTEYETEHIDIPRSMGQQMRFENLKYLSFAHPHSYSASWPELVTLLSDLPTITHLSLAYWPCPSNHPYLLVPSLMHSLADRTSPSSYEAAGILRRLSRSTFCLKWLDLEGCSDWIHLLPMWTEYPEGRKDPVEYGPEWNHSWRNVVSLNLAPGWEIKVPDELKDHVPGSTISPVLEPVLREYRRDVDKYGAGVYRALSVHQDIRTYRANDRGKAVQAETGKEGLDRARTLLKGMRSPP